MIVAYASATRQPVSLIHKSPISSQYLIRKFFQPVKAYWIYCTLAHMIDT